MFTKKEYQDRQSEYPNRRKLVPTADPNIYDVQRNEGVVTEQGVPFNSDTMNDLESRVEAAFIETSGGMSYTLVHTYDPDTKTHNLTGTIPTTGIATAIYTATSTNAEGDKWAVNGEAYTAKPTGELLDMVSSTFVSGDIVSALIDTNTKKLSFTGGSGGSGKGMQQFELPMSNVYDETSSEKEWQTMQDDTVLPMVHSCYDETTNTIYSVRNAVVLGKTMLTLCEQNATTLVFKITPISDDALSLAFYKTLRYNGGTYFAYNSSQGAGIKLFKMNIETKSLTFISDLGPPRYSEGFFCAMYPIDDDNVIQINSAISSTSSYTDVYIYKFSTNEVSARINTPINGTTYPYTTVRNSVFQLNSEKTKARFLAYSTQAKMPIIVEVDIANKISIVAESFNAIQAMANNFIGAVQIGSKLLYISSLIVYGGKTTGEIDLFNRAFDPTKYPELPADSYSVSAEDLHLADGRIICHQSKLTSLLQLVPIPPESKPPVAYLFKGDIYSAPYIPTNKPINVLAIPNQSAFTITNMPQIATEDREIHMGQYELQRAPTQLLIKKG